MIFHKHLIRYLLTFEIVIVSIFIILCAVTNFQNSTEILKMYFIVFIVSERAIGLAILVLSIRLKRNDYIINFSFTYHL